MNEMKKAENNNQTEPYNGIETHVRKKFKQFLREKNLCVTLPYTRAWNKDECEESSSDNLPKWVSQWRTSPECFECPRELDEYEKKLWIPTCKPPIVPKPVPEPMDSVICIFCLKSLYTGGYLLDLCEKLPYIKKQSEENKDDITWRIGIRTRITVHKNCYNTYTDRSKLATDSNEIEDVDSDECDEEKKPKDVEFTDFQKVRKQHFCLKKFTLPEVSSGKF